MNYPGSSEAPKRLEELRARRSRLIDERMKLAARDDADSAGVTERINNIDNGIARLDAECAEADEQCARYERMARIAADPANRESSASAKVAPVHRDLNDRDRAMQAIERMTNSGDLSSRAADVHDKLLRRGDPRGDAARYIAAVASEDYLSAFLRMVADPAHGHFELSREEVEAMRNARIAARAMSLVDSAGGYAVPATLDPTILLSSDGALNPFRQVASVIQISSDVWNGVSSDGVTVAYSAEGVEVAETVPTLAQPSIKPERCTGWVPFSIELGQDYSALIAELTRLLADSKDVVDAGKFLSGTGTNEPSGILGTGGLSTTQRVLTAGSAAFAVGDNYLLKQALPARYMARAAIMAHPTTFDVIYRQTPAGSTTEPQVMPTREGAWLGRPRYELSTMDTGTTAGKKIALYGDFAAAFRIVDRIGMMVELVPHVMGANHRPTGQRGLFAIWRTGSDVIVPNAARYCEIKA